LVKSESPHGLRGKIKQRILIFVFNIFFLDPYSTFTSQSFFPHNAHRFGGGASGKYFSSKEFSILNSYYSRYGSNTIMAIFT
jgi:hypothetical protein